MWGQRPLGRSPHPLVEPAPPVDQQRFFSAGRRPALPTSSPSKLRLRRRKAEHPGGATAEAAAPPGAAPMGRPSTTGRSLGVSLNSTYIARLARGHGGRCRVIGPVAGCPAPFPSRRNPSHPIRTNPDRLRRPTREDLELGRHPVAEARLQSPSFKTLADEVGHRRTGGSPHQHVVVVWFSGKPDHQSATTGW